MADEENQAEDLDTTCPGGKLSAASPAVPERDASVFSCADGGCVAALQVTVLELPGHRMEVSQPVCKESIADGGRCEAAPPRTRCWP